jgi:hypothetical protein
MTCLTEEELDGIIETLFYNISFNIPIEETLEGFKLSKDDFDFIVDYFKKLLFDNF